MRHRPIWILGQERSYCSGNDFAVRTVSSDPLYSHRCTLPDRTLWFGQACLYEDRITIQGWTWQGRYQREIAIERINEVDWCPRPKGPNLILDLDDGRVVRIRLRKGGGLWNAKLHALLGESLLDRHSLSRDGRAQEEQDQDEPT